MSELLEQLKHIETCVGTPQPVTVIIGGLRFDLNFTALRKHVERLEKTALEMLNLEALRMYERDLDHDAKVCPCPCPGCNALRDAIGLDKAEQAAALAAQGKQEKQP